MSAPTICATGRYEAIAYAHDDTGRVIGYGITLGGVELAKVLRVGDSWVFPAHPGVTASSLNVACRYLRHAAVTLDGDDIPELPAHVPCPACVGDDRCDCMLTERLLRSYAYGPTPSTPMTLPQRLWCMWQVGRVEGHEYTEHDGDSDQGLAGGVLGAWVDFCRDKGFM